MTKFDKSPSKISANICFRITKFLANKILRISKPGSKACDKIFLKKGIYSVEFELTILSMRTSWSKSQYESPFAQPNFDEISMKQILERCLRYFWHVNKIFNNAYSMSQLKEYDYVLLQKLVWLSCQAIFCLHFQTGFWLNVVVLQKKKVMISHCTQIKNRLNNIKKMFVYRLE